MREELEEVVSVMLTPLTQDRLERGDEEEEVLEDARVSPTYGNDPVFAIIQLSFAVSWLLAGHSSSTHPTIVRLRS